MTGKQRKRKQLAFQKNLLKNTGRQLNSKIKQSKARIAELGV